MSINDSSLRNLTTSDFLITNSSEAADFWLLAYDAFQYITTNDDRRKSEVWELKRRYPDRVSLDNLALAASNSSVTDAIKHFLPQEYLVASHDWLCGQFQRRFIPRDFLDQISRLAQIEVCYDIVIKEPLLALGTLPSLLVYALVLSICITSVLVYLIHATRVGPQRTAPESFKNEDEDEARKRGIMPLRSCVISKSALPYPKHFVVLAELWILTIAFYLAYTMFWYVFGGPNTRLVYDVAFIGLGARTSVCTIGCIIPLAYKVFELPDFTECSRSAGYISAYSAVTMLTDLYIVGSIGEIVDQQNLFYRDRPCSDVYFGYSLSWVRLLIGIRWAVLAGMGVLYRIIYGLIPCIFPRLKHKTYQWWRDPLWRAWSLIHPLKIWVVVELVSLAQAIYVSWQIRTAVSQSSLYTNFHSSRFDAYVFMLILSCVLMMQLIWLLVMDLRARWRAAVLWNKVHETVDGSEDPIDADVELDDPPTSKL